MEIREYLKEKGISFKEFEHEAVFTCEESKKLNIRTDMQGMHAKSLFLKDRKTKKNFYLIILPCEKKLDMKGLVEPLGEDVKFANEDDLKRILDITPGAVSPFNLINDKETETKVFTSNIGIYTS